MENRQFEPSIPNSRAGMESLLKQLKKLPDSSLETTLFCMEHTARAAPGYTANRCSAFFIPLALIYGCNQPSILNTRWA
ncbi:hypothetical protein [Spirosoma liriopis]|uniref:hypothetical protein n=1 Tax=Spirosoma liriopis TaxID=2937440 RepID=UPI0021D46C80|nr:hypothetical protein [Spirosoma liriopis]